MEIIDSHIHLFLGADAQDMARRAGHFTGIRNVAKSVTVIILSLIIAIGSFVPVYAETSSDLKGRVIILDPGHDEETSNYFEDYSEHTTMLILAEKIKSRLEGLDATVYLTRSSDDRLPSEVRCAYINKWALEAVREARLYGSEERYTGAADVGEIDRLIEIMKSIISDPELAEIYMNSPYDPERKIHPDLAKAFKFENDSEIQNRFLFISLHSNASSILPKNSYESGASAYYLSSAEDADVQNYYDSFSYSDISSAFGNMILDHLAGTGFVNLGSMAENYFMIREHNLPGVLVENGHHTNPGDRAMLQSDDHLEIIAGAYADAIVEYFSGMPLPERFSDPVDLEAEEPEDTDQGEDEDALNATDKQETEGLLKSILREAWEQFLRFIKRITDL